MIVEDVFHDDEIVDDSDAGRRIFKTAESGFQINPAWKLKKIMHSWSFRFLRMDIDEYESFPNVILKNWEGNCNLLFFKFN